MCTHHTTPSSPHKWTNKQLKWNINNHWSKVWEFTPPPLLWILQLTLSLLFILIICVRTHSSPQKRLSFPWVVFLVLLGAGWPCVLIRFALAFLPVALLAWVYAHITILFWLLYLCNIIWSQDQQCSLCSLSRFCGSSYEGSVKHVTETVMGLPVMGLPLGHSVCSFCPPYLQLESTNLSSL